MITGTGSGPLRRVTELGADARVRAVVSTSIGALLLTFTGQLWVANEKLRKTTLRGGGPLCGGCVTSAGTLLVVGNTKNKWQGRTFRSENQAKTFKPSKLPAKTPPLRAIAALPDGRVIAGGEEAALFVSDDDGKTFTRVPTEAAIARGRRPEFVWMCTHQGAIYAGGPGVALVKIA